MVHIINDTSICICIIFVLQYMESVGNSMSNGKYEGCLGDVKRPDADASKWVYHDCVFKYFYEHDFRV